MEVLFAIFRGATFEGTDRADRATRGFLIEGLEIERVLPLGGQGTVVPEILPQLDAPLLRCLFQKGPISDPPPYPNLFPQPYHLALVHCDA